MTSEKRVTKRKRWGQKTATILKYVAQAEGELLPSSVIEYGCHLKK